MNVARSSFGRNITANSLSMIVSLLTGVWLARILTAQMGIQAYAIVSMATALTMAISIFTSSLNSSVGRYLTQSIAKHDAVDTNRFFNSAFWGTLAVILMVSPVLLLLSVHSAGIFNVHQQDLDVQLLVGLTLIGSLVMTIGSIFGSSCYASSRFDLLGGVQVSTTVLRLIFTVVLIVGFPHPLVGVGVANLAASVVFFVLSIWAWRKVTPYLSVNWNAVSKSHTLALVKMGFWTSIDAVGMLLITQALTILVSNYEGNVSAGYYGLYLTMTSSVVALGAAIASSSHPQIYELHFQLDTQHCRAVVNSSTRITLCLLAFATAILVGFRFQVVNLWLGTGYETVSTLLLLGLPIITFSTALSPLLALMNATNKTKLIAVATLATGAANLLTLLLLYSWGVASLALIVFVSAIWRAIKSLLLVVYTSENIASSYVSMATTMFQSLLVLVPALLAAKLWSLAVPTGSIISVAGGILWIGVVWSVTIFIILPPFDVDLLLGADRRANKLRNIHRQFFGWRTAHFESMLTTVKSSVNYK